jgi:KipI family sensor histidine kinase inhibitor
MTEAWLAVHFADGVAPHLGDALVSSLDDIAPGAEMTRTLEIAVRYDGPDLDDVARACGISVARVRELHLAGDYTVLFLGFMPGFAYLGGLDAKLEMPRLETPRTRVPKNAVAIAGHYAGIYPFASAGGWRLIGTAIDVQLFDPDGDRGALLHPGDRVRFEEAR